MSEFYGFLSYSRADAPWAHVLHANLEKCGGRVFLDAIDLPSGNSWVQQIQAGLDQAQRTVLVASPDALASPRVMDEWGYAIAAHRDWKQQGKLQVAYLLETPLPPFLADVQYVDFRQHDARRYLRGVQELLAGLRGLTSRRHLPELPPGLEVPPCPSAAIPAELRRGLVDAVAVWCRSDRDRERVEDAFCVHRGGLQGFPSAACAASAALVAHTNRGGTARDLRGALRLLMGDPSGDVAGAADRLARLFDQIEALGA